jgi:hypothetical protein
MHELTTRQLWTYRAPQGFESSRLVIGALVTFEGWERIICCSAIDAPRRLASGKTDRVVIPFLPMSEAAFLNSVVTMEGAADLPEGFAQGLSCWQADPRGLTVFTVPFDGYLDRMIARQMAAIVGPTAA